MLITGGGETKVQMGNFDIDEYGISFVGSDTDPAGYTGTLTWVQVINNLSYTDTKVGPPAIAQTCVGPTGLDGQYPYDQNPGPNVNDSPSLTLDSITYSKEGPSDTFTMYLLWSPPSALVPIPLGYVKWSWSAAVSFANSMWSITSSNSGPVGNFVASNAYPQWNAVVSADQGLTYHCQ